MKKWINFLLIFLCIVATVPANGQSKSALKKRQSQLNSEIRDLDKIKKELAINKKKAEIDMIISKKKIGAREELIQAINYEILLINKEIVSQNKIIDSLNTQLKLLKDQYAKMVVYAYKNREATNKIIFIFSSADFNQAYKRLKYIKEIGNFRAYQAKQILFAQQEIEKNIEKLRSKRVEKEGLSQNKSKEKEQLRAEESGLKEIYGEIKQNEKKIRKDIEQKRRENEKLNQQIQEIIQREIQAAAERAAKIAKEKREKEAARRAALKKEGKTPEEIKEQVQDDYALTPQAQALSKNFEANKGKLPWPIVRGTISASFGNSRHPVFKDLTIINNGINIITGKQSAAKAVFGGTVVAILVLPNGKNAVLLQHGEYFTLYSNLSKILVKRNEEVQTGEELGIIKTDDEGKTELHFELWKGKEKQNPQTWLLPK